MRLVNAQETLKCPEILKLTQERNVIEILTNMTSIFKIYRVIPNSSSEAKRNFPKL